MRRSLVILGVCLLFLGLISIAVSHSIVKSEYSYPLINRNTASGTGTRMLSVEGNLTEGNRFFINFTTKYPQEPVPDVLGVNVTVTDKTNNNSVSYEIPIYPGPTLMAPFPRGLVNHTGPHKVDVMGFGINVTRVDLRLEIIKQLYPYDFLFLGGIVVLGGGVGISLIGLKSSKPQRHRSKIKK
jgi:hypothetical protein